MTEPITIELNLAGLVTAALALSIHDQAAAIRQQRIDQYAYARRHGSTPEWRQAELKHIDSLAELREAYISRQILDQVFTERP